MKYWTLAALLFATGCDDEGGSASSPAAPLVAVLPPYTPPAGSVTITEWTDGLLPIALARGTFGVAVARSGDTTVVSIGASDTPLAVRALSMISGEFTGDAADDLVLGTETGVIFLDGTVILADVRGRDLARGDFDGDGFRDLAVSTDDQTLILLGHGDGTFEHVQTLFFGARILAADFNQDGVDELAVIENRGDQYINFYWNLASAPDIFLSLPVGGLALDLAVLDVTADGWLDVVALSSNEIRIFQGWGDGSFDDTPGIATLFAAEHLAVADFDADGAMDYAISGGGTVAIAFSGTTWDSATFAPPSLLAVDGADLLVAASALHRLPGSRTMLSE